MNYGNDYLRLEYPKFCSCDEDCRCEENSDILTVHEWAWDEAHSTCTALLTEQNLKVEFNRGYSYGTAAVRGNKLFEKGRHYYWEIKMVTAIYGTDVMVGVGTDTVDLNKTKATFFSLLGHDKESFGFSYQGYIQHGGKKRSYGSYFGSGSLVGIYLDMWKGTLEFYLNRKPLGIAFTGLRDLKLYPMACSTAAKSVMRVTHCSSLPASLQLECLAKLRPEQRAYLSSRFPGLRHVMQSIFANVLQRQPDDDDDEKTDFECPTKYVILDEFDFAIMAMSTQKKKRII